MEPVLLKYFQRYLSGEHHRGRIPYTRLRVEDPGGPLLLTEDSLGRSEAIPYYTCTRTTTMVARGEWRHSGGTEPNVNTKEARPAQQHSRVGMRMRDAG